MNILLANDDGIEAYGIRRLASALSAHGHNLTVVAPDGERSAAGHSISFGEKSICYKDASFTDHGERILAYRITGTPADCVKFGVLNLGICPDIVIAGINHGNNLGSEIMYSGTVSVAFEGAYLGIRSIAMSCGGLEMAMFDLAINYIVEKVERFTSYILPPFTILNINYPQKPAVGEVFTRTGVQLFSDRYEEVDGEFYLRGERLGYIDNPDDCDVNWSLKNYITITPLCADRTDERVLEMLKGAL